jgi:hypothetical protein
MEVALLRPNRVPGLKQFLYALSCTCEQEKQKFPAYVAVAAADAAVVVQEGTY